MLAVQFTTKQASPPEAGCKFMPKSRQEAFHIGGSEDSISPKWGERRRRSMRRGGGGRGNFLSQHDTHTFFYLNL